MIAHGEMADRIRSLDWFGTHLGPIQEWSESLLTAANMILASPLPMQLFWGPEFVILYNDALIPILTDKHPHALGQPASVTWAEAWDIVGPQMMDVRASGKAIYHRALMVPIHRNGTLQDAYWDYSYSPVYNSAGDVEGVLDIVRDVSSIVIADKARRESEERLELAMEAAELGMWSYEPDTGVVVADERMHRIFGSPDLSGSVTYWLDLLHPDDSVRVGKHFSEALEGKHSYDLDYRIVRPDATRWIRSKGRLIQPAGAPRRMFAVVEDITTRKEVEGALEQSEKELRLSQGIAVRSEQLLKVITDALPAYISYLDRDLRYVRVNCTYEEWFKRSASSMMGRTIDEVLGQDAADSIRPYLMKALSGERTQFEYRIRVFDQDRVLSVVQLPDLDADGNVRGVIVQGQDITDRKRAEEALIQSEKLAAVGRLAASIAHEINNPLEAVTNLLFLARALSEPGPLQEYLDTAERELRRVSIISNQTLRFHKQSTRPRKVTCADLLESVFSIHQGRLINSHVHVERGQCTNLEIECFDGEIRQVLNNLVGNAIDAMHPAGGRLIVRARRSTNWKTGQKGIHLAIADTGSGMPPKVLRNVFEAFYTTKGIGGTGLGLWVSKEIVDRHQGALRVRSSTAQGRSGTVFSLFLPSHAAAR